MDAVGAERLFTTTGRAMLVVLDEVMVLFELVIDGLDVVEIERLLTMTGPRVVADPRMLPRFVDEEDG
jgi:hypothetical protein